MKEHLYKAEIIWTGNTGKGTKSYQSYERSHLVRIQDKPDIKGSADPSFFGDTSKHNPEELFLASISACHMLWYLHFCSVNHITVTKYSDRAEAVMHENKDGSGYFKEAVLNPVVTIIEEDKKDFAKKLHESANRFCFIANSCNFKIMHIPIVYVMTDNT